MVGRSWSKIEPALEGRFIYSGVSKGYGVDPIRFINVDLQGSYVMDFLERVGVFEDHRAWVALSFDAADCVKSAKTEWP